MTWGFFFLAALLVGLSLAATFGILESLPKNPHVALPRAEFARHRRQVHIARFGVSLVGFGGIGLVLVSWGRWTPEVVLAISGVSALVFWMLGHWVLRMPCATLASQQRATVVREIPPGGYGQVRLETGGAVTLFAAQSEDPEPIPAGSEVEVVDCQRSVVLVRKIPSPS